MRAWIAGMSRQGHNPASILTEIRMLKDDRVRTDQEKSIFNFRDISDRMG